MPSTTPSSPQLLANNIVYAFPHWPQMRAWIKVRMGGATSVTLKMMMSEDDADPSIATFTADDDGQIFATPFMGATWPNGTPQVTLIYGLER